MADSTGHPFDLNQAAADLGHALRDGAYIAIGLGVLGFQRVQVQRVEFAKQLEGWRDQLGASGPQTARDRAEAARSELATQLSELGERVDEALAPARELGRQVVGSPVTGSPVIGTGPSMESQFEAARAQLAQLARAVDEQVQPLRQQFDQQFDLIEQYLPPAARSLVQSFRAAAAEPEQRLRHVVGLE
jgi:hypothetical protein